MKQILTFAYCIPEYTRLKGMECLPKEEYIIIFKKAVHGGKKL